MCKKILFVNEYASTPETGMGGRGFYLCQELAELGYDVTLAAASPHHLLRKEKQFKGFSLVEYRPTFSVIWFKNLRYKGARSIGRVINWFVFGLNIFRIPSILGAKPDVIIYSSPSIIPAVFAVYFAKLHKIKLILDVRDIWPKTLVELAGFSKNSIPIKVMTFAEVFSYRHADAISSNIPGFKRYLDQNGHYKDLVSWVPNGIDNHFLMSKTTSDCIRKHFNEDDFIIGYAGTIGFANNLLVILEAAELLKSEAKIKFAFVGDGNDKSRLLKFASDRGLDNVKFFESVTKSKVSSVLAQFDAFIIAWKKSELYEYGVGANKIPEYMSAGKPIIHSYSGRFDPIQKANCGKSVPADDPKKLSEAVVSLFKTPHVERKKLGFNGQAEVASQYTYAQAATQLHLLIQEIQGR